MLITPRQSPDYCKQVIAWRFFVSRNESSDRLLVRGLVSFLDDVPDRAVNLLPAAARYAVTGEHGARVHHQGSVPTTRFQRRAFQVVGQRRPVVFPAPSSRGSIRRGCA